MDMPVALADIEADVYEQGAVNRTHILDFLRLLPTNDGQAVAQAVRDWLEKLHNDPTYDRVFFPQGDIDRILGDLDSYGRLLHETVIDAPPPPQIEIGPLGEQE